MKNKVIISVAAIILLTRVVSASASNDHVNEHATLGENNRVGNKQDNDNNGQGHRDEDRQHVPTSVQVSPTGTATLNNEGENDCDDNVKNHGTFVSCIAHEHLGGNTVSEAAHSDTGKKNDEDNANDDSDDISPTITPTETPTPTATQTPTITPTVTITPEQEQSLLTTQLKGLIDQLKDFINSLTSFLHH